MEKHLAWVCFETGGLVHLEDLGKISEILANNVRALRKKRGMTQEALAESAGMSFRGVQQIEHQINWPTHSSVEALAKALGVSEAQLFTEPTIPMMSGLTARDAAELLNLFAALHEDEARELLASLRIRIEAQKPRQLTKKA